ncbi:MAG: 3'(2'),5'-bisphosphate nucleotidase CysQ [Bacteroidales bacterium]|nr:3'(2'),5'-bisphosphate nucleotidase CysQ [Bacteroidales bacterium]
MNMNDLWIALRSALKAGQAILSIYQQRDFGVEIKADSSPLTLADRASHKIIMEFLDRTDLPVLSEEGREIPWDERRHWEHFWLVDPLDGTKEFINRNGEFTVNIALIHHQVPVAGIILAPVQDLVYLGMAGKGSFRIDHASIDPAWLDTGTLPAHTGSLPLKQSQQIFTAVASRSHTNPKTQSFLESLEKEHGQVDVKSVGSSLKFCLIAEGSADVYPRFGPTCEWDTAAGQAIVEAAGGRVIVAASGDRLCYNKENLVNPEFVANSYKTQASGFKP